MAPRAPRRLPRAPQERPKRGPRGPKRLPRGLQEAPKRPARGPKRLPRWPRTAPRAKREKAHNIDFPQVLERLWPQEGPKRRFEAL
eukprot:4003767-Pyramimonas_sp.AAC.1